MAGIHPIPCDAPERSSPPSNHHCGDSRLTDSQSLKNRLASLEALDESRRMNARYIEAIQQKRKIIF
jgi:hypothetical protein